MKRNRMHVPYDQNTLKLYSQISIYSPYARSISTSSLVCAVAEPADRWSAQPIVHSGPPPQPGSSQTRPYGPPLRHHQSAWTRRYPQFCTAHQTKCHTSTLYSIFRSNSKSNSMYGLVIELTALGRFQQTQMEECALKLNMKSLFIGQLQVVLPV